MPGLARPRPPIAEFNAAGVPRQGARVRGPAGGRFAMSLISYLTKIHFADDIVDMALGTELTGHGVRRVFIVTDPGIAAAGLLERNSAAIPPGIDITIYDRTPENPTEDACSEAAALYKEHGCDGIVGLGGGSSLDLAKVVGLVATHDGPLANYTAVEGGITRIRDIIPPVIAIPTTAGTGSEVGRAGLIVLRDGRKLAVVSPYLIPKVAICDPQMTLGLPPLLTAATGMDALTHCVETYIATAYNPPADGIALDGLRRAAGNIERAVENGADIDARREMMAAVTEGAMAFQKGLGGVHAMSHALGGLDGYRLHHGTLNAVLLPHVLEFNRPAVGHRYADLKAAMNLTNGADLGEHILRLNERLGLPRSAPLVRFIAALRSA